MDDRGIDFLGYRSFRNYTILRKSTYKKFKKKMLKISKLYKKYGNLTYSQVCTINSYIGWLKWCNCDKLILKYYNNTGLEKALKEYNKIQECKRSQNKLNKFHNQYCEVVELLNNLDIESEEF